MKRSVVATHQAPAAVGPYSQAIRVGDFVYTAGQVPLDPTTGELVGGSIEDQTRRALDNIKAVLEAADSSLEHVVKTTVFLTDLGKFAHMNAMYANYFPVDPPARSTVEVSALPLGAEVEIEAVAIAR